MKKLIADLKSQNISLSVDKDELVVDFDGDNLSDDLISKIKENKLRLIDYLTKYSKDLDYAGIPKLEANASYAISDAQKRLWILSQFEGGSAAYNTPGLAYLNQDINRSNFKKAIDATIERHEILRTVFKTDETQTDTQLGVEVRQWILSTENLGFKIDYQDLRNEKNAEEKAKAYIANDAYAPFDLENGPLFRAALLHLEEDRYTFYYNMHHLISDGWSMDVLSKDVLKFYDIYQNNSDAQVDDLRIQYKDYSAWQLAQIESDAFKAHKSFWLARLQGELPVVDLPGNKQRPGLKTYNGCGLTTFINKDNTRLLKTYANEHGGSLFMSLLATWNVLIYRYTGQKDLIIGTPVAGRDHADLENQIGVYINTLALRNQVDPNDTFDAFFEKLKQNTLKSYDHQKYPFDRLVENLELKRDISRSAVFDMMVILQNNGGKIEGPNLSEEQVNQIVDSGDKISKFDIEVTFREVGDNISFKIIFNPDIYKQEMIQQLMNHFSQIIYSHLNNSNKKISEIDYLNTAELRKLQFGFNNTELTYQANQTIVDLFEAQVKLKPNDVALVFEEMELTFDALNDVANRLAHFFNDNYAIEPDGLIGLQLPRSEWMLISILGVLKAGGAYIPLDLAYPKSRVEAIKKDSGCQFIFGQSELSKFIKKQKEYPVANLKKQINPSHLAYVIYTSGSTGTPKGVLIEHSSVVNFFSGMKSLFGDDSGTLLSMTNATFDISVLELLWTLTQGYKVVIQGDVRNIGLREEVEHQALDFSLFYFGNPAKDGNDYSLLTEGAKYADANGYQAVWTPERHFNEFGGLFPNPALMGATLAAMTKNVQIRAGSVVVPLHHPIRIAEEWSVVDNLSDGRVGIACASGWVAHDFVLEPTKYAKRQEEMYRSIDTIQKLWEGESLPFENGNGELKETKIFPKPKQVKLPIWITSAGNVDTFISAGKLGFNILTHLLTQSIDELSDKIAAYRKAYSAAGHDINKAKVTVMLHTYVADSMDDVDEKAKKPFINYLKTSTGLLQRFSSNNKTSGGFESIPEEELDALYERSYQRYRDTASLIGTQATCLTILKKLSAIGVNEIGALIDFGVDFEATMEGLNKLTRLKGNYNTSGQAFSIAANISRHQVSHLQTTPSMGVLLDQEFQQESGLNSLKHVLFGGEQLRSDLVKSFHEKWPAVKLYNMYGPTETTIWSTVATINPSDENITIGKPIANTQIYILDENKKIVPIGVKGEIHIGGKGLARGYTSQKQTKAQFIENPHEPNGFLYRTGDFGSWLPNGSINYAGRKDDQVKIRGYRIELKEIELALIENESVDQVVVTIFEGDTGEQELAAYLVSDLSLNSTDLRKYLKSCLPEYMVPSYFVQLDELPLNTSGKINRKALPNPLGMVLQSGIEYVAPRNELEEKLVEIWKDILKQDKIGVNEDFFSLGGHSLNAIRLSGEYQMWLSVKLTLKDLFTHTTIESHAQLIDSAEKNELFQIEKVSEQEHYAISDAQRRIWVLSQFEQGSIAYNMPSSIYLDGVSNIEDFYKAIEATIQRHEILRTIFKEIETGEIRQWVLKLEDLNFEIQTLDLRGEKEVQTKVDNFIAEDAYKPFDLKNGPLLRAALLQVSDDAFVFYYNMHHVMSDGWSLDVLSKDVFEFYDAFRANKTPKIRDLRIQYKDYSAWQLAHLRDESFSALRSYWLNALAGELPVLNLPGTKQRPRIKTHTGQGLMTYLNRDTTAKLKKYAEERGGSFFMSLLAVWNVLMYRYTGQSDIIIGTPVAGREHLDLENQIGFYVNTLAQRNKIDPAENFNTFFDRLKENTLRNYDNQMYPFDRLVEELELNRDTSRSAVFDVLLTLQSAKIIEDKFELSEADAHKMTDKGSVLAKFDLNLSLEEIGGYLSLSMDFNTDIYEKEMVVSMLNHFRQLIHALLENPEQEIGRIDYLTEAEKEQQLVHFKGAGMAYSAQSNWVDLFEEQVGKTPNKIAVSFEGTRLTYSEINEVSNQLANYLRQNYNPKPNDLIGIKLARTEWMIIAVLGVLKSGGAYVSIDPNYPQERIDFIEKDSKCLACLDESELNEFRENQASYSIDKTELEQDLNNLAYVIYTSGSTGTPKGVMISHKNVYSFIKWTHTEFEKSDFDSVFFTTSLNFDLSVFEIFHTLSTGKELQVLEDGLSIPSHLDKGKKQLINTVPSVVGALLDQDMSFESIAVLNMAGEPIPSNYKAKLIGKIDEIRNLYGPSEDTTYSTSIRIDQDQRNLIGKPIFNTQVYILNETEQLQSLGVIGEICISGDCVAKGYLNKPELTKEKFIKNPFNEDETLYKTGDLGRWLSDGNIEFLGRKDNQVKIRGFRIEIEEIEQTIFKNEAIESAVVIARENEDGNNELVAYIVSSKEHNLNDIRGGLKDNLPAYMIPAYFVQLDKIPLTPNGKTDTNALPNPEGLGIASGIEYMAPRNEVEKKLVEIWEEVLKRQPIGVKDDFFTLGGDSLKAMKVVAQLNEEYKLGIRIGNLFSISELEELAVIVTLGLSQKENKSKMKEYKEIEL